jgi:hypothetical protein
MPERSKLELVASQIIQSALTHGWKVRCVGAASERVDVVAPSDPEHVDFVIEHLDEHGVKTRLVIELKALQAARTRALSTVPTWATSSVPAAAYRTRMLTALVDELTVRLDGLADAGHDLTRLGDPKLLAEQLVNRMPLTPSPLEDLVGPFYDTPSLSRWLNRSRQALDARVRARTLLGLPVSEGPRVYPAWQFADDGNTIPHLAEVLRALADGTTDPWTWALWLSAADEEYDGLTAWQWLKRDRDPAPILADARSDAKRWAS